MARNLAPPPSKELAFGILFESDAHARKVCGNNFFVEDKRK
jgi:hypothetical protein